MTFILGFVTISVCALMVVFHMSRGQPRPEQLYGSGVQSETTHEHYKLPFEGSTGGVSRVAKSQGKQESNGSTTREGQANKTQRRRIVENITIKPPPRAPLAKKVLKKSDSDDWGWFVV